MFASNSLRSYYRPWQGVKSVGCRIKLSSLKSYPNAERFHKFRTSTYHAPHIERLLLLSDLHCDYAANREWLHNICLHTEDQSSTMILIAGDVSHNLSILQWTFRTLKKTFREVAFVPGNHDLWLDKPRKHHKPISTRLDADDDDELISNLTIRYEGDGCADSIEKLEKVFQLCVDESVHIGPVMIESRETRDLLIVPLLSWYHDSFDTEPSIECWGSIPPAMKVITDYRKTKWPQPISSKDDSIAEFMDELNDIILDWECISDREMVGSLSLITFSHFLPRIELLPEKRYLMLPTLHSCIGSTYLETRLRFFHNQFSKQQEKVNHLHVFGHSHLSWDQVIKNVRYIHVPLAYPKEWVQRRRSLEIGTMQGEISKNRFPVCIWIKNSQCNNEQESFGFPDNWLGGWWSGYYANVDRKPHLNKQLAPWAARRFRQLPGGTIEDFDHVEVEMEHKLQHPYH